MFGQAASQPPINQPAPPRRCLHDHHRVLLRAVAVAQVALPLKVAAAADAGARQLLHRVPVVHVNGDERHDAAAREVAEAAAHQRCEILQLEEAHLVQVRQVGAGLAPGQALLHSLQRAHESTAQHSTAQHEGQTGRRWPGARTGTAPPPAEST
jgi:hypothetical protein